MNKYQVELQIIEMEPHKTNEEKLQEVSDKLKLLQNLDIDNLPKKNIGE